MGITDISSRITAGNPRFLQIAPESFNPWKTLETGSSGLLVPFNPFNASTSGSGRIAAGLPFLVVDARTWTIGVTASEDTSPPLQRRQSRSAQTRMHNQR